MCSLQAQNTENTSFTYKDSFQQQRLVVDPALDLLAPPPVHDFRKRLFHSSYINNQSLESLSNSLVSFFENIEIISQGSNLNAVRCLCNEIIEAHQSRTYNSHLPFVPGISDSFVEVVQKTINTLNIVEKTYIDISNSSPAIFLKSFFNYDSLENGFQDDVYCTATPFALVFNLSENDFKKIDNRLGTEAITLHFSSLPPELRGKIVLINRGSDLSPKDLQTQLISVEHENWHSIMRNLFEEPPIVCTGQTLEALSILIKYPDIKIHRYWAERIAAYHDWIARSEILSYGATNNPEVVAKCLGSQYWTDQLLTIKEWLKDNRVEEQTSAAIYSIYESQFRTFLQDIREYQWLTRNLYGYGERASSLSQMKVNTLILLTPLEERADLASYLGWSMTESSLHQKCYYNSLGVEFQKSLEELFRNEHQLDPYKWPSPYLDINFMFRISANFPAEAFDAFLNILKFSSNEPLLRETIPAIQLILTAESDKIDNTKLFSCLYSLQNLKERLPSDYLEIHWQIGNLLPYLEKKVNIRDLEKISA